MKYRKALRKQNIVWIRRTVKVFWILLLILTFFSCNHRREDKELATLYEALDDELSRSTEYQYTKESTIQKLKAELEKKTTVEGRIPIINLLINEYEAYNSDSTLRYINLNIHNYSETGDNADELNLLKLRRIKILASAGFVQMAMRELQKIQTADLSSNLREEYYNNYIDIYQYLIEFSHNSEFTDYYHELRSEYIDSLLEITDPRSFRYVQIAGPGLFWEGKAEEGIALMDEAINNYKPGDREYSILAYLLSYVYGKTNRPDEQEKYLILSSISDVKGVIKENVTFKALATINFEEGDIDRASRYIEKSFDDAQFYRSRIRSAETADILPLIEKAYIGKQEYFHHRLSGYIIAISLLAAGFLISLVWIYKQFRKISRKNAEIEDQNNRLNSQNEELNRLNKELQKTSKELISANNTLRETSRVKDEYMNAFMKFGTRAISGMEEYILSLKKYVATGNRAVLLQKIDSNKAGESIMEEFFDLFDTAFLKLYPDFVSQVNSLMKPDEIFILKHNEKLNQELRILALIKLGIKDSNGIAEFLHYSIATVYTYRSKLKKRARHPDKFEDEVGGMTYDV